MPRACFVSLVLLALAPAASAQSGFELSVGNIMRGPEHVGEPPSSVQWSADGRWIHFRWKPGGQPWHEPAAPYRVRASGGEPERLSDAAADSVGVLTAGGDLSRDRHTRAVSWQGDLYLVDMRNGTARQLTETRATERSPRFGEDGRTLYFLQDNNIFARDLATGSLRQLSDVRTGPASTDPPAARGQRRFLEEQQRALFEHIRIEQAQREAREAREKAAEARDPLKPIYLDREERVLDLAVEPAARYALITTARGSGSGAKQVLIPFWVTRSGYTEPRDMRTKVGDEQGQPGRLGVVSLTSGQVRWLDVGEAVSGGDTAQARTLAMTRFLGWNEQGTAGLVAATSADFKDAWLWALDADSGALTLLVHDRDEAWVAGPCPFWFGCAGWLPDGRDAYFVSERDGYAHLYRVSASGGEPRQLTRGPFEVHDVAISPAKDRFLLHTSEGSPHEVHFHTMALDGGSRTRVTTAPGRQDVTVSPDGRLLAVVHSTSNRPPELYVAENRAGASMRQLTTSPTEEWLSGPWVQPEIVRVPARDGVEVPARIYRPEDVGAQPNGAAVIFVHGAGYLQNVHDWWSTYYREYMFHHLLAQRGYVVLDMDYRGSAGYGRDWRTAIYRHMGGKDLTDHVDGARWLGQQYGIDAERVGIYGGSYGGFITLMALFTAPESFGAGAALRSVTDWAHYNHGYTGRILNLPQDDTTAYRQSSPIYFAEGLEDPLLIAHGMVDVNVHFSDVVRLVQRLIELQKTGWELAVYPVEDHAFVQPTSWTDEYRRILELFEKNLHPVTAR